MSGTIEFSPDGTTVHLNGWFTGDELMALYLDERLKLLNADAGAAEIPQTKEQDYA